MGLKVLKAAPGDKLKHNRRKRKEQLEELYQIATPEQRKMIDDLQSSYISKQQSMGTSMNRQSATWLWDDFSNRVWDIIQGKNQSELYSTIDTRVVDEDPYGHYSKDQVAAIGNSIAQNYFRQTPTKAQEPAAKQTTTTTATPAVSTFDYQWNKGFTPSTDRNKNTDRQTLLTTLTTNIQNAINEIEAGKKFHNTNGGDILQKEDLVAAMTTLKNAQDVRWGNNRSSVTTGDEVLRAMRRLSNNNATADEYYNQYFKFDLSLDEKKIAMLKEQGYRPVDYTLGSNFNTQQQDYLRSKKARVFRKGSDYIIFDEEWNPYQNLWYVNTEGDKNSNPDYATGIYSDDKGNMWFGNMQTASMDRNNPYKNNILTKLIELRDHNRGLYVASPENFIYDAPFVSNENKLMDQLYYQVKNGDFIPDNIQNLSNYIDASKFFNTNAQVLAMNPNNSKIQINDFTGLPQFTDRTAFFYLDPQTKQLKASNLEQVEQALGGYDVQGYDDETADQMGLMQVSPYEIPAWQNFNTYKVPEVFKDMPDLLQSYLQVKYGDPKIVAPNKRYKIEDIMKTPKTDASIMEGLYRAAKEGFDITIPIEYLGMFRAMQAEMVRRDKVVSNKQGGVIKALEGTVVNYGDSNPVTKKQNNIIEVAEANYKKNQQNLEYVRKKGYSSEKAMRAGEAKWNDDWGHLGLLAGSVLMDIASMATAAASATGVGAGISLGTGLLSSGLSFADDIRQDGFDWGDLKRLAVNVGMDLAAPFTFGQSKLGKIIKSAVKITPFVFGLFDQIQNGHEYQDIWNKAFVSGQPLTQHELTTLVDGIRLIMGSSTAIMRGARMRKIQNDVEMNYSRDKKVVPISGVDESGKPKRFEVKLKEAEEIAKAKDYKTANELFQIATGNESVSLVPDKNSRFGHGFKGFFNPKNSTENPLTNKTLDEIVAPQDLVGRYEAAMQGNTSRKPGSHVASDLDIALGNTGPFGLWIKNNKLQITPKTAESITTEKDGGRLERLQNYIKNK